MNAEWLQLPLSWEHLSLWCTLFCWDGGTVISSFVSSWTWNLQSFRKNMPSNAEIDWADSDASCRLISLQSKGHLKQKFNCLTINRPLSQKKKVFMLLSFAVSHFWSLLLFFFFTILVLPYHTEWKAQRFFFTSDIHSSSPLLYFPVRLKAGRKKQQKYCGPYFYTQKPDSVLSLILSLCNFIHFTDVVLDPYQCKMEVGWYI